LAPIARCRLGWPTIGSRPSSGDVEGGGKSHPATGLFRGDEGLMSNWKLLIEDDAGKTIVVPVARDIITIGRKDGNTIRLTERNVSRFHAKLIHENGTVFIEDLESYNGVKLNGDRIKGRVEIQEGDLIEIGDYHLALQNENIDALPTEPPMEQTAKLAPHPGGQIPPPAAQPSQDDYDDDQFAGDTQRWEPPSSMEPVAVGGVTVNDQAPVGLGADIPTTDDTVPLPAPAAGPSQPSQPPVDLDQTVRNPSAPNMAAPGGPISETATQPFTPTPSGSDEASGDFLPPPGGSGPVLPTPAPSPFGGFDPHSDVTQPLVPPSQEPPLPGNGAVSPGLQPSTGPGLGQAPIAGPSTPFGQAPPSSPAATPQPPLGQPLPPAHAAISSREDIDETAAVPRAGSNATESHRLVAVNTVFAGSVFPLRRDEIIVGRVEDNDLVIEHRSVSRSHAKLVKDGDGYAIVDLKSANGVLVNGEEVNRARLKSGDIIELGRVRLRFVPIGETFSLTEDEIQRARLADTQGDDFNDDTATALRGRLESPTTSSGGGRNPNTMLLVAFGAIIVLLLIVIVILLTRSGGSGQVSGDVIQQPAVPVTADMSDEEKEATARENEGLLAEAESMWLDLKADGNGNADAALERVRTKIADRNRYKELQGYLEEEDWDYVVLVAEGFSEGSAYAEKVAEATAAANAGKAKITEGRIEKAIEAEAWDEAESALTTLAKQTDKGGRYEELKSALASAQEAASSDDEDPDEVTTTSTRRPPRTARNGKRPTGNKRTPPKRDEPTTPVEDKPEVKRDTAGARRALDQAATQILLGSFDQALRKAQEARRLDPELNDTNRALGQIYEKMGKHKKAVRYYKAYLAGGGSAQKAVIKKYLASQG
jgi:pSer/pThr/pTyr-binding forkhead associated (FHA) protein/tetratricopeptide (TPR) repeat protein